MRDPRSRLSLLPLILIVLAGCATSNPRIGRKDREPATLPDRLPSAVRGGSEEIEIHAAVLTDEEKRTFTGLDFGDDVLAVYLRVRNLAPTRLMIAADGCRLFERDGDEFEEITRLETEELIARHEGTAAGYSVLVPFVVLTLPLPFMSLPMANSIEYGADGVELHNGIVHGNVLRVDWGRRSFGPGAIETGVLFFDGVDAGDGEELHLSLDVRDLVHDWHVIHPLSLTRRLGGSEGP